MTLTEFMQLSGFEKANALNVYGVFLAERKVSGDRMYLYAINYFYVELFHELSDINNRGVIIYRVFDDVRHLDAYLDKLDISEVYE